MSRSTERNPCQFCADRLAGCHSNCQRYTEYRAQLDEANYVTRAQMTEDLRKAYGKSYLPIADVARYIISNLACVVDEMPDQPVRAFVKATAERRHYTPYRVAMQSPDMREYLIGQARDELSAFTNKYRNLQELARVVQVMDEFLEPGRQRQTDAERSLSAAQ